MGQNCFRWVVRLLGGCGLSPSPCAWHSTLTSPAANTQLGVTPASDDARLGTSARVRVTGTRRASSLLLRPEVLEVGALSERCVLAERTPFRRGAPAAGPSCSRRRFKLSAGRRPTRGARASCLRLTLWA